MERRADMNDNIITVYLSASFYICGDSNSHHKKWLVHATKPMKKAHILSKLDRHQRPGTQIIEDPTRVPDTTGH